MFLSSKAALLSEGVEAGTHSGVNQQFGRIFIREKGVVDEELGRFLSRQQTLREQADYDPDTSFDRKDIEESLEKARGFVQKMKEICQK